MQQILEKAEKTGSMNDVDSKISFGTNVLHYLTQRLRQLREGGVKLDKSHKDYKEGKKVAKQVLKRMEMRGNVIPWCQFAQFESEVSGVVGAMKDVYAQVYFK